MTILNPEVLIDAAEQAVSEITYLKALENFETTECAKDVLWDWTDGTVACHSYNALHRAAQHVPNWQHMEDIEAEETPGLFSWRCENPMVLPTKHGWMVVEADSDVIYSYGCTDEASAYRIQHLLKLNMEERTNRYEI